MTTWFYVPKWLCMTDDQVLSSNIYQFIRNYSGCTREMGACTTLYEKVYIVIEDGEVLRFKI